MANGNQQLSGLFNAPSVGEARQARRERLFSQFVAGARSGGPGATFGAGLGTFLSGLFGQQPQVDRASRMASARNAINQRFGGIQNIAQSDEAVREAQQILAERGLQREAQQLPLEVQQYRLNEAKMRPEAAAIPRIVTGDSQIGQRLGLNPNERARVDINPQTGQIGDFKILEPSEGDFVNYGLIDESGNVKSVQRVEENSKKAQRLRQAGYIDIGKNFFGAEGAGAKLSSSEATKLRDTEIATRNFVNTVGDAYEMLQQNPDINTFAASAARVVNNLQQEAKAVARNLGKDFDENILDPSAYGGKFDSLGIQNQRMRSLITSLAFQAAAASGQTGRSVSNRDVERFIEEVGASAADPRAFAQTLADVANRSVSRFETDFRVRTGEEPPNIRTPDIPDIGQQEQGSGQSAISPVTRDAAMEALPQGHNLGTRLEDGRWEVLDKNGNVAGYIEPE